MPQTTAGARVFAGTRILGVLALLPLLGGCVAAAAVVVPAATAIGVVTRDKPADGASSDSEAGNSDEIELTTLTQLPAPTAISAGSEWQSFISYALEQVASRSDGDAASVSSALLAPESAATLMPHRLACQADRSAVILDLDPGETAFAPGAAMRAAPGLADGLARLRDAGIIVMWISQLDANHITAVADALQMSGLDPGGTDPVLLVLGKDNRKQLLREQAGGTVCVIALAGDQRSDFDEMFDYLRDPESSHDFDLMLGSGWFLTPIPLQ